jgi:hypothetical protein
MAATKRLAAFSFSNTRRVELHWFEAHGIGEKEIENKAKL